VPLVREAERDEGADLERVDDALAPADGDAELAQVVGGEVPRVRLLAVGLEAVPAARLAAAVRLLRLGLGLPVLDRVVAVVAEEERPRAVLGVDPDEDARTLEDGVDPGELLVAAGLVQRDAHVVLADVLELERRRPRAGPGEAEDELRRLARTQEPDLVSLAGLDDDLVGRAELAQAQVGLEVVLDDEARAERDHLGELVLRGGESGRESQRASSRGGCAGARAEEDAERTSPRPSVTLSPTRISS